MQPIMLQNAIPLLTNLSENFAGRAFFLVAGGALWKSEGTVHYLCDWLPCLSHPMIIAKK